MPETPRPALVVMPKIVDALIIGDLLNALSFRSQAITTAENALEATEWMEPKPHLIILKANGVPTRITSLPSIAGFELTYQLRVLAPNTKVIFVSEDSEALQESVQNTLNSQGLPLPIIATDFSRLVKAMFTG